MRDMCPRATLATDYFVSGCESYSRVVTEILRRSDRQMTVDRKLSMMRRERRIFLLRDQMPVCRIARRPRGLWHHVKSAGHDWAEV